MAQMGKIEIRIVGQKGNNPLSPDNFDIKEIISLLSNIEPLLYPGNKGNRPDIAYKMEAGSVRNIFIVTKQIEAAFAAVLALVATTNSIDALELPSAKAIEEFQNTAKKKNYKFEIKTESAEIPQLTITPTTQFYRSEALWVDADLYLYGTLIDAGGKDKSNIHLETKDFGTVVIAADRDTLKNEERNLLYKEYGIQAKGQQNIETGEIDKSSLKLVRIIDYTPVFDGEYLQSLMRKVGSRYDGVDVDRYVSDIRGLNA